MKSVFAVACAMGFTLAMAETSDLREMWETWKKEQGKVYDTDMEEAYRFTVFTENVRIIDEHNARQSRYRLAVNKFADMGPDEFLHFIHGHGEKCLKDQRVEGWPVGNPGMDISPEDLPDSVDWTTADPPVVNPIKDQGNCGSCWAFSAAGATESRSAIATGTLNSLSEQELVDCSDLGNAGCQGGWMDSAFVYIEQTGGLALESQYTYKARNERCEASSYEHYDPISGFMLVERDNATALMAAIAEGPVSIGIEADQEAFQFYSSGILDGRCGTNIDHGVVAVGYGTDGSDQYWKVRNSWGESWGEEGYVRICKECDKNGDQGECCILCQPSYPIPTN